MSRLVLLDSTVLVDAVGSSPGARHASQHIFSAVLEGRLDALISIESIQETFTVVARRRGDRKTALKFARQIVDTFRIAEVDNKLLKLALDLLEDRDQIMGADAIVLATAIESRAAHLVTRDKGLGAAAGSLWVDPSDSAALARLVAAG